MNRILLIAIMVIFGASMVAIETNGYLSVKSADGVEILVGGKLAGVVKDGQLFLELAAGTYEVTAQGYGFTSETIRNVKIDPLKATTLEISLKEYKVISEQLSGKLQIDLIRKYGTVRVFSLPFNGAQVTINGESYGETDIELTYFPAGQLSVEVEGPNKSKVAGVFLLEEYMTLTLLADFIDKKIYQLYEVSFDFPAGVEVVIDNTKIARNIPSTFIGGTYSVELITRNSPHFEEITRQEIVISKPGYYYLEPDSKPMQAKMVLVEKGSFTMGDTWGDGLYHEKPTHKGTFTYDFYMGKYEVTFSEYDAFCEATGRSKPADSGWGRGQRPVINVSWNYAIAYCNWLSEKEKLPKAYDSNGNLLDKDGRVTTDPSKVIGYRLPTEAEWEYAARGGNNSNGYKYSGSDNVGEVAWYDSNSGDKTQEVGKKSPNELGIYDMSGNVWEWCSDWYNSGYYSKSPTTNPYNSTAGSSRVIRGGSLGNNATNVRVVNRLSSSSTYTNYNLGFRICRTVPYEGENRPPLAPFNASPSDEASVWTTSVSLRWDSYDPDGDVMAYDVYFDTNANPTTKVSSSQRENTLAGTDLSYNTTYYWKVVAKDNKGGVTEGPVWKFTTTRPPRVPSSPIPANSTMNQPVTLTLSWECSDPDGDSLTYDVYFGTNSNPTTKVSSGQSGRTLNRSNLSSNTTYYWKVVAKDNKGGVTEGPLWKFTTTNRPPKTPFSPNPANNATNQPVRLTLYWECSDPDGDPLTYDIYFDTKSSPTTKVSSGQSGKILSRSNLSYNTTYYWKVVAKDSKGAITEGPVWSFTISAVPEGMVFVEKGSFKMGDTWGDGYSNEKPTHSVTFTYDFWFGKYEVTFDEYDAFCNATGKIKPGDSGWGRGSRPVMNVSWWDAIAYCNWLSEKENLPKAYDSNGNLLDKDGKVTTDPSKVVGYRLPTEAEWEYAARGGNKSKGYKYSGSDNIDEVAWYKDNSGSKTQEVGKKAPNELGIYDMSGNLWEWCSDWFGGYSSSAQTNPYNSTAGSSQVLRGGSSYYSAAYVRVTNRSSYFAPILTVDGLGFRIARTVP